MPENLDPTELSTRILNGEEVPLSDLVKFIEQFDEDLTEERKKREKPPAPPKEVDFF